MFMKLLKLSRLSFGTAGIPLSAKAERTEEGIKQVRKLGLDALELEFVRQVYIKKDEAPQIAKIAKQEGTLLTCHAPYFINLSTQEKKKLYASIGYIYNSAKIAALCGAYSVTFHAAYYMQEKPEKVFASVKEHVRHILKKLEDEGLKIWLRPETTGRVSQFGSLQELLKLSQELEYVMPCIDFSHLHARTNGKFNSYEEFSSILAEVEKALGKEALQNMHIHVSGIAYGEKGEKHHLNLQDSDINFRELCKAWRDFKIKGIVISESPNIEGDALLLQKTFKEIHP